MRIDFESFTKSWHMPSRGQFPIGSRVYCGFQGSGKTLSMIHYVIKIRREYPACAVFSNIKLTIPDFPYAYFQTAEQLSTALNASFDANGKIILIDEAHLFFNKKSGISLDVLTAISQQRKDRTRIVFSSQIWEELDISLRKQVKEIVRCHKIFNLQINTVSNGETLTYDKIQSEYVAKKLYTEVFKHSDELYRCYDTRQKIVTNKDYTRQSVQNSYNISINK
jgi:hypothetical protein